MIIALTGMSNVGKSYIADLLSDMGYAKMSVSFTLKKLHPYIGEPGKEREPYTVEGITYSSYREYLCKKAEYYNVKTPNKFIDPLLPNIGEGNFVIDDLRTPRQLRLLKKHLDYLREREYDRIDHELIVIRVLSDKGFKQSFMDDYDVKSDGCIVNNGLIDDEIIKEISRILHSV